MSGNVFVDTNVFVYAVDESDALKQLRAQEILETTSGIAISPQVMNEFFVVATRKIKVPLPRGEATTVIRAMANFGCVSVDATLVETAIHLEELWQIAHWDALMVAAARQGGCDRILTEDLAHGAKFDGLTVENPFRA